MVGDSKGKKLKAADKNDEENAEQIDGELVLSIEKLQEIQDELEKINEKASDEVLEVEKKYNEMRKPVYDKRNEIINSIPDFWLTAFLSHPALSELLSEEDHKIFKHLTSIEVEDSKDVKSGYSITFNFSPNPYFEDTKLTKTFTFLDEGTTKVTATSIKWKEGMGIPNGVDSDKKGNKRPHAEESTLPAIVSIPLKSSRTSGDLALAWAGNMLSWEIDVFILPFQHPCSFFSWFSETQQSDDEIHDEVAEIIKEDLWPNPLTYFNNEPDEEDFEVEDDDDDEGKGEGSEDDDDEQDDDEDAEEEE
ncbi:hypothetical protein Cgig2_019367 [Carnegiea gigantea]|uniref:Uncharacterized protein n=1 Tax=Carnegiea gigantea TaxID=171969 RepID=A0A9Q1GQX0_9CARY|nr:hypothetical protein Cgig2_019367 [Carnegiea gigantea]